ncbi:YitT family protein [Domibacillus indicus]|uniref:YitT family protein n=1 Tax=Domibacillus indicus TaxID=1437523 RepID=UPI00204195BA|nr:YitT family protein [Domibacillus indicus]MCM3789496.1 YitT family protein [Domibacillus indicus]
MNILLWTAGAAIQAAAMSIFLFPHAISSGGAAGISIMMNHVLHTPYAATIWGVNAIMIVLAFKWLGLKTAAGTMYCVSVTATVIHFLTPIFIVPPATIWLDLPAGALLFGIGLGILFKAGASSGGMDIAALILSKWRNWAPGRTLFYINTLILIATGIVVDVKTILYAIVCQWIASRMIDFIQSAAFHPVQKKALPKQ